MVRSQIKIDCRCCCVLSRENLSLVRMCCEDSANEMLTRNRFHDKTFTLWMDPRTILFEIRTEMIQGKHIVSAFSLGRE